MAALVNLIIAFTFIGLAFYAVWWFLSKSPPPEPFGKIINTLVALAALIVVLMLLFGGLKVPQFVNF